MNTLETAKRVGPWAATAVIAAGMGAIALEQHPGASAVNGQSTVETQNQAGKTITRPHSGSSEVQSADNLTKRYVINPETGITAEVADIKDIFGNNENSGAYFCKNAPEGQVQ